MEPRLTSNLLYSGGLPSTPVPPVPVPSARFEGRHHHACPQVFMPGNDVKAMFSRKEGAQALCIVDGVHELPC